MFRSQLSASTARFECKTPYGAQINMAFALFTVRSRLVKYVGWLVGLRSNP